MPWRQYLQYFFGWVDERVECRSSSPRFIPKIRVFRSIPYFILIILGMKRGDELLHSTLSSTHPKKYKYCKFCLQGTTNIKKHLKSKSHTFFCDKPFCGFVGTTVNEIKCHLFNHYIENFYF